MIKHVMKKKKKKTKKPYIPRVQPLISTSSKVFIDKKTKAKHRRILNKRTEEET